MLWCVCADYITLDDIDARWVWRAASHVPTGVKDRPEVIAAAKHAMQAGDRGPLDRVAEVVFLGACPPGGESSVDERERQFGLLHREIQRRRVAAMMESKTPFGPDARLHPADWAEYKDDGKRWFEAHRQAIADIFYGWGAAAHPEVSEDTDFKTLISALAAVWGDGRIIPAT